LSPWKLSMPRSLRILNLKPPDWRKVRVLAVLLVAGVLMLTLRLPGGGGSPGGPRPAAPAHAPAAAGPAQPAPAQRAGAVPTDPVAAQEEEMDRSLEAILSRVAGAGEVRVAVSLAGGEERRFAADSTTSRTTTTEKGGATNRTTTQDSVQDRVVLAQRGSGGGDAPVTAQVLRPQVRGVLVVAGGAASPAVRAELSQAVAAAADVPLYRVVVLPAANRGGDLP
jgi:stage III sporulation protein AG